MDSPILYVKALAQNYYGIQDVRKIEVLGLDINGADVDAIMASAADQLEAAVLQKTRTKPITYKREDKP